LNTIELQNITFKCLNGDLPGRYLYDMMQYVGQGWCGWMADVTDANTVTFYLFGQIGGGANYNGEISIYA
jgi:hypothetical protein